MNNENMTKAKVKPELLPLIGEMRECFGTPLLTYAQFKEFIDGLPLYCGNTYEEKLVQFVADMQAIGLEQIMLTDKPPLDLNKLFVK